MPKNGGYISVSKPNPPSMNSEIAEQSHFRPPLPHILGCQNYREQRELLIRIDELMEQAGTDRRFVQLCLEQYDLWLSQPERFADSGWQPPVHPYTSSGEIKSGWLNHTRCALRVNIMRYLSGDSLRQMSINLADSALVRWFCYVNEFGPVKPQSKSTVDRYEDWIDADAIRALSIELTQQAAGLSRDTQSNANPLGLEQPIDLEQMPLRQNPWVRKNNWNAADGALKPPSRR